MATKSEKLEKAQYMHNQNLDKVERGFTGQHTVNWCKGEIMSEETKTRKEIRLE